MTDTSSQSDAMRFSGLADFVARAAHDADLRRNLSTDPRATLRDAGFALPEGMTVRALENTAQRVHLVLPHRGEALSDEQLDGVAGAGQAWERMWDFLLMREPKVWDDC